MKMSTPSTYIWPITPFQYLIWGAKNSNFDWRIAHRNDTTKIHIYMSIKKKIKKINPTRRPTNSGICLEPLTAINVDELHLVI